MLLQKNITEKYTFKTFHTIIPKDIPLAYSEYFFFIKVICYSYKMILLFLTLNEPVLKCILLSQICVTFQIIIFLYLHLYLYLEKG